MLFKQNTRADQPAIKSADSLPPFKSADSLPSLKSADSASAGKLPLPSSMADHAAAPTTVAGPISAQTASAYDDGETGKRLIVGKGIQLKGEITACDRLVVEGQVEVTMNATRTLEITPSGHFIGSCEVEEADISGVYDGDLTVRGRLIVHHNGRVTGKICYGELELERGGQIAGELSVRPRQSGQAAATPAQGGGSRRSAAA
jgi:cytoskeletal protein CcmA (bactofilin family)